MSGPNLNIRTPGVDAPERFDLKKHVQDEKPFFSGIKMFVSVVVSLAAVSAALLGGTYLLIAGPPADFYQKPIPPPDPGKKPELTPAQEKSFQDSVTDLFTNYQTGWNSGTFPTSLTTSDFVSTDNVGKISSAEACYEKDQQIKQLKVANLIQVSDTEASATVDELSSYGTGMKNWFLNAGGTSQDGQLAVQRVTEYEYRLVKDGAWKIKSRKWLRQSGALIQQADEATESIPFDTSSVTFDDKRPNKEMLDKFYQSIAGDLQNGVLASSEFPSTYSITFDGGGTIDRFEIAGRLDKFKRNTNGLSVKYTIESVDQTGPKSADATVRYEALFVPVDSPTQNQYVAVWRDKDTWTRDSDTSDYWVRYKTTRLLRSPILQHYEEKTPPAAPGAPGASTAPSSTNSSSPPPMTK